MTWQGIEGHDRVVQYFRRALEPGRLANSFLFTGPEGIGKRSFALKLAQSLLCQARPEKMLDACGHCPACLQAAAGSHPDLETVAKPPDKSFLPLELLIGDKEHRMREGLCYWLSLRPSLGRPEDRRNRRRGLPQCRGGQQPAEDARRAAARLAADPDRHQPGRSRCPRSAPAAKWCGSTP